ncbi:prolyl oligopeptidase family protein [Paraburkholderia sp. BL23I1N1]|uniref:alpha/beta hydrolase family protein n=1 Tax=Paraburkholderia sp. BL23I1N1 TaxID=1938802 RepID=UPI000E72191A|nr:prolyl oligopeptidase family serine peptidase [Paraburkholderia sp. BL23I1N1]RKE37858.1 prolyl oligopeptidase family protein [Paraburkholderia sp. BL23I1N1]
MPVAMRNAALVLLTCLTLGTSVYAQAGSGCDKGCNTRGQLLNHRVTLRLSAAAFSKLLASNASGQQLAQIAGAPACGVEIVTFRYRTIGGAGEPTNASGALMIPGGRSASCSGPRPLMLYAHGTTAYRNYNIADITQTDPGNGDGAGEGISVAAMYAAQGYIVVATNYAGYAGSDLTYHPYLNADQQSADVIDSLRAARAALSEVKPERRTRENGKLFVTGYSQGGFVALATHRALQAAGVKVTASAPGSGPYALAATADALIEGEVNLGSTLFTTLIVTGFQRAYENIYRKPGDFYESAYAPGIENLLPSLQPLDKLFAKGKLPSTQLFNSVPPAPEYASMTPPTSPPLAPPSLTPLFAAGFGNANLVRNAYRLSLLEDAAANPDGAFPNTTVAMTPAASPMHPLRQAFKRNDLRNWSPRAPVLLCGGGSDPTVFFFNARIEQAYWQNAKVPAGLTSVLDVDSPVAGPNDPYAPIKQGFANAKATLANQAVAGGATDGGASAVLQAYHGELVASFCMVAARAFFTNF